MIFSTKNVCAIANLESFFNVFVILKSAYMIEI